MYGIREDLLQQVRADYSVHLATDGFQLDCSMGSNPYGRYPGLRLDDAMLDELCEYPYAEAPLRQLIRQRFAPVADLAPEMIAFACGSIGSVITINRMLQWQGKTVVSMAPTFTAVTDDILTYQPDYHVVRLRPERNYEFDVDELLAAVVAHPGAYVYIDNPNNPTGQIYPLEQMRAVVQTAEEVGSFVLLDEAYGDYMPMEASGISLVHEFANTAVIRTFAKGMGAAGLRLGYTIGHPDVMAVLEKVNTPFSLPTLTNAVAQQLIASNWIEQTVARVQVDKPRVLAALKNLRVAHTSTSVPISMVYADDPGCDVADLLLQVGIRAISCADYDGLGPNAVRLNLHHDIDTLIRLLQEADRNHQERA